MADIEIKCNVCNSILDGDFVAVGPCISVDPCENCAEKERDAGYAEGYSDGRREAKED